MIAIIKYNAGNVTSVQNALKRLGTDSIITDDPQLIKNADKVIFAGVGHAASAMNWLTEKGLDQVIKEVTQPFLGICLGLQLMCDFSEEGNTKCLGIFDTQVKLFSPELNVPHMGWNNLKNVESNLFSDINLSDDFYFVHSYYAEIIAETTATCDYILPFSAALQRDNFYATQFHPEKSADIGEIVLQNFIQL